VIAVKYLNLAGNVVTSESNVTFHSHGVVYKVGFHTEVLIPWGRVLEVVAPGGTFPEAPSTANRPDF
jgi:hypothetical protein